MTNEVKFQIKKYKWGWHVRIKVGNKSLMLGNTKSKDEAENIIKSIINNPSINYIVKEY
jgi:uncharacterized protein YegP (UPF0339 family)